MFYPQLVLFLQSVLQRPLCPHSPPNLLISMAHFYTLFWVLVENQLDHILGRRTIHCSQASERQQDDTFNSRETQIQWNAKRPLKVMWQMNI